VSRVVILNADDLGYEPRVTLGIVESMRQGVVSSTTFLVTTPSSEAAAPLVAGLAVGLHLDLVRFTALSTGAPLEEARVGALTADFVEAEARAQLARLEALLGRPATHVDVHKHAHRHPQVLAGLARAARAAGLPVRSIDPEMRAALRAQGVATNDAFLGEAGLEAWWTPARWEAALARLPADGVVELMCHPGYAPRLLRSGYGAQREVELATFTAPSAREALARHGVELSGWGAVPRPGPGGLDTRGSAIKPAGG
jgi:predicted glycoside hydrolase/deacetylase ChbG (UPF0249 family)